MTQGKTPKTRNHKKENYHEFLYHLVAATRTTSRDKFLPQFIQHFAEAFQAKVAILAELIPEKPGYVQTIAIYAHSKLIDNIEYELAGTPCHRIYSHGITYIPHDLLQNFPIKNESLGNDISSYFGMPLFTTSGEHMGHLCLYGSGPIADFDSAEAFLMIFGARAEAALQYKNLQTRTVDLQNNLHQLLYEEQKLYSAKESAEASNRSKSEFIGRMSHDIKAPLSAILGFSELIKEETAGELNPVYKEYAESMFEASRHMKDIINEMLDVVLLEVGKLKIKLKKCHIKSVLDSSILIIKQKAQEREISISYKNDIHTDCAVLADEGRLKEICINLLTNAIKYNFKQGQVIIDIQAINNTVRVTITDHGPGIAKIEQAKIFNEFERLQITDESIEGTGIGLAITKRLVEHMHGTIGVESKLGKGSSFWFEFEKA